MIEWFLRVKENLREFQGPRFYTGTLQCGEMINVVGVYLFTETSVGIKLDGRG